MSNLVSIQFKPTTYPHNVYTGSTSGSTSGIICSAQTVSCTFTVDDTYKSSYDTIWLRIVSDEGCKEQLYQVFVNEPNCGPEYCEFSATTVYNGLINDCDLEITITSTEILTSGGTGSATISYTKNHGPVTYLWSNGQTGQTATGLTGGTYTVNVTDSSVSACTITGTTTVYEGMIFSATTTNAFNSFNIESYTLPLVVNWGDGTENIYTNVSTGITTVSRTYASPYTGLVKLKATDLTNVERFDISGTTPSTNAFLVNTSEVKKLDNLRLYLSRGGGKTIGLVSELPRTLQQTSITNAAISGGTADIPRTLTDARFYNENYISGNTNQLPTGLTVIDIWGNNTVTGSYASIPKTVMISRIYGNNTISGFTTDLPTGMTSFGLLGSNTLLGNISNLPTGLTFCVLYGQNSVSGNTSGISGRPLTTLTIDNEEGFETSGNTITGFLSSLPRTLTTLHIGGANTISGNTNDSPTGVTYFNLKGQNNLVGDIGNLPNSVTDIFLGGQNTVSGNTADIPSGVTVFDVGGLNTITGTLNNIPANIYYFSLRGNSNITGYTAGRTWASNMNRFIYIPNTYGNRLSDSDIDKLLIDFTGTTWTTSSRFGNPLIWISGSGTTASIAAKSILTGYGVTITYV